MFGLGATELLIILAILVVLFGARRIPRLARSLGEAVQSFRTAGAERDNAVAAAGQVTAAPAGDEGAIKS